MAGPDSGNPAVHSPDPHEENAPVVTVLLSVLGLLAVAALTLGTAISVASEFALTALERSQVDGHVAENGDRRAHAVQGAHRELSFQLSGSQLGITITTLVTGYIAEPAIASLFRPGLTAIGLSEGVAAGTATVLALLLATTLSMVFGELVPKNLAIADPLRTARAVVWLQSGFAHAFRWLISGLNAAANAIVRRLGVEPAEELRSARSPRELGSLVRSSAQHGTLDAGTATLLDRSLRFTDRVAEDLMTPRVRVESLDADDTVADLVALARRSGFSRFPVHDRDPDAVLGVVHVKQAFGVPVAERGPVRAARRWCRRCPRCPSRSTATRCSPGCASPACSSPWSSTSTAARRASSPSRTSSRRSSATSATSTTAPSRPRSGRSGAGSWLVSGLLRDRRGGRGHRLRDARGRLRDPRRPGAGPARAASPTSATTSSSTAGG